MTKKFPELLCPCCKNPMRPQLTHRGKPYYQCLPCGVQVFVRTEEGIAKLREEEPSKT